MNPHSDEQGATHMHTNDFACMHSSVHVDTHIYTHKAFCPYYLLPQPTTHTHSLGGKEEMSFLRIEYSGMSLATLTLHMQNPALCIHAERHKTGTTIKNVISLPMTLSPLSSAENKMLSKFHHHK